MDSTTSILDLPEEVREPLLRKLTESDALDIEAAHDLLQETVSACLAAGLSVAFAYAAVAAFVETAGRPATAPVYSIEDLDDDRRRRVNQMLADLRRGPVTVRAGTKRYGAAEIVAHFRLASWQGPAGGNTRTLTSSSRRASMRRKA